MQQRCPAFDLAICFGIAIAIYTFQTYLSSKNAAKLRVTYDCFRDTVRSGDILLFSSNGRAAKAYRKCMGSPFNHVAIAVKDPVSGELFCFDSSMSPENESMVDVLSGMHKDGPAMYRLSDIKALESYGAMTVVPIVGPATSRERYKAIMDVAHRFKDWTFMRDMMFWTQKGLREAGLNPFRCSVKSAHERKSAFCSEFVTILLSTVGIADRRTDPSSVMPHHFASGKVPLLPGWFYGVPYMIVH